LVRGTADTARFDFDHGLDVIQCLLQYSNGLRAGASTFLADAIDGAIDDFLGGRLFAPLHDHVDELRQHVIPKLWIGKNGAVGGCCSTGHLQTFLSLEAISWDAWRRTWNGPGDGR
jgi:hypothetical protein